MARRRWARLALLLLLAGGLSLSARADDAIDRRIEFRIPPQPLDTALLAFARQSGLQLVAVGDLGGAPRSHGASGVMSTAAALQRLLAGSGYDFALQAEDVVTVSALAAPATSPHPARTGIAPRTIEPATVPIDLAAVTVVAARHRDERWIDVPLAVSVMDGARIEALGLPNATAALALMPGVSAVDAGSAFTMVQIRGVSSSLGGNDNGYYLDDVPFTGITVPWHPETRSFDLDAIEVLKGPQGTLFGEGSMGGTVRVNTRAPELDRTASTTELGVSTLDGGGHGTSVKWMGNVPLVEDRLALRAVATRERLPGWVDTPDGDRDVNAHRIDTQRLRLRWAGGERWSSDAGLLRNATAADGGGYIADDRSLAPNPVSTRTVWLGGYVTAQVELAHSRLTLIHSRSQLSGRERGDVGQVGQAVAYRATTDFDIRNTELRWASTGDRPLDWLLGYAYRAGHRGDTFTLEDADIASLQDNRADALFGEVTARDAARRWSATAGLRYFAEDVSALSWQDQTRTQLQRTYRTFVPRLAAARHLGPRTTLYASRATGFRSGQVQPASSLLAAQRAGLDVPEVLAPDRVRTIEAGLKHGSRDGRVLLQAALFHSHWRDLLVRVPIDDLSNAVVNSPGARMRGADLELAWTPLDGLRLALGGALVEARHVADVPDTPLRRGTQVYNVPRTSVSGSASYAWPLPGALQATAAASVRHHARRETGAVATVPGDPITVLDLRVGVESPRGWSWHLRGDNLGNARGAVVGRNAFDQSIRLPPRGIGLEFGHRY